MTLSRRDRWVLLSGGIATVVAVVDAVVGGGGTVLIALLAVGPVVAATRVGAVPTAVVAAYSLLLGVLLGLVEGGFGSGDHVMRVAILAVLCALAVWTALLGERLGRSRDQLRAILEGVADGVTAQQRGGGLVYANRAAAQAAGMTSASEMIKAPPNSVAKRFDILDEEGRPLPLEALPGRRAMAGESVPPTLLRHRPREGGEERWTVVKATPIRDEAGEVDLVISILEDVTDRMRAERAERFLSEASKVLSTSLDYETTLRRVAELAVPDIADWCAVEVVDELGELRHVALAAADPGKIPLAQELRTTYAPDPRAERGAPNVLRTGRSELYPDIPEQLLREAASDERHLELMRRVGMTSAMVVPMIARGRILGVVTLVSAESRRHFEKDDLALAEELARRAATAVDNARLYSERAYIARALQESLLPPTLPEIAGVEIAARFRAAGEGAEVGGDFYDLFDTGDERWAVVIGDVCGKGAAAAALTALARYTLRAAAMREGRPSAVLSTLNELMVRQRGDDQFCTVTFAQLSCNGDGANLTVSSGGHPLPLVLRADGRVEGVGRPGTLLGVTTDARLEDDSVALGRGDTVVLYTDGVTDARAPGRILAPSDLASMLKACAGLDAATIAERIERAATSPTDGNEGDPRDDVAILVLQVRGEPARSAGRAIS